MKHTMFNVRRSAWGSVKSLIAALAVGDSLPCADQYQRYTYYITARRLGYKLTATGNTIKRIQ
jgi:hypothetical protein